MSDFDSERIKEYARVIEELGKKSRVYVIVGGGSVARDYINLVRELGADETTCDYVGIDITRINASILASTMTSAPGRIPVDLKDARELSQSHNVVVMGGTFPGHTTDATAALLSEYTGADLLLIATSVDGVYSADPKKDPNAVKLERVSASELVKIVSGSTAEAGGNNVVDLLAAKIIERSGIKALVFMGSPENIFRAFKGDVDGIGTVIEP